MNSRALAAKIIQHVLSGSSLSEQLAEQLPLINPRDQAFVQAICYGTCRWYGWLDAVLNLLMPKPLKTKDRDIYCLLLIGLYQLHSMRTPEHAAVSETVKAVTSFKKPWAKRVVNAVLREFLRSKTTLEAQLIKNPTASFSHPDWLIQALQTDWPDDWQMVLTANNQHPPLVLRVNAQKNTRDQYLAILAENGIPAVANGISPVGIDLTTPVDVTKLPLFNKGFVSVQDAAAQLAAELLALAPGQRVLDACAAPGGKTAHLLEQQPRLAEVIAIDNKAERLTSVKATLQRLQLNANCLTADAGEPNAWWDGKPFDRILLDAPCSASGVIRRHPDIKLLRRATDISKLAQEQLRLLTALWPLLQPDGILLYVTCSVFAEENTNVVAKFLQSQEDVIEEKILVTWGKQCAFGRQILPGMHGTDGFYFAKLRKKRI